MALAKSELELSVEFVLSVLLVEMRLVELLVLSVLSVLSEEVRLELFAAFFSASSCASIVHQSVEELALVDDTLLIDSLAFLYLFWPCAVKKHLLDVGDMMQGMCQENG